MENILKDNITEKQRLIDELISDNTKLRAMCKRAVVWCNEHNVDGNYTDVITDLLNVLRKE